MSRPSLAPHRARFGRRLARVRPGRALAALAALDVVFAAELVGCYLMLAVPR